MKTMTKILSAMTLVVLFYLLTGCMPCYYAPNAQNVPLFTEKKQANGTFGFQFGSLTIGYNMQGAVAVSDHIGLIANYNHFSGKGNKGTYMGEDYSSTYKGNMGEFGLGYYYPFKNKFVVETYAGIGTNTIKTAYERYDGDGNSSLHFNSYFIQPAICVYRKNIKVAFSSRFRLVDYDKIQFDSWLGESAKSVLIDIKNNPDAWLFEPAFTFRAGGEHVKFQAQIGISVFMGNSEISIYDPLNINFGVVFSIHGKKDETTHL
jgi:hypothetical protein